MERTKRNKSRNMTDFLRYRKDDMSGEERNSFERDLQKDPFAQEASEGLSLITAAEAEKDLSDLKKKLKKRTMKSTPHIYYRLAAAASLVLLVSISVVIYNSQFNKNEMTTAKNDIEVAESPLTVAATEPLKDKAENSEAGIPSPSPAPVPTAAMAEAKEIAAADELADADEILAVKVTTEDSEASENNLIAVSAIAETDAMHDEAEKKSETAVAAGAVLQAQEHPPLAARSKSALSSVPPQPVTGLDSFNLWIEKNIRNPRPDKENEEVVVVSFKVMADSTVTDINIISSPGQAYSIEAERLIREGPEWKPATVNGKAAETVTSIQIVFR
jgi:hypothetical protein